MKKLLLILSSSVTLCLAQVAPGIQWQNMIGGSGADEYPYIEQTPDGGYICAGVSNSPVSGDKTEGDIGSGDFWILKLDGSGNIQWQNTIGGSFADVFPYIKPTSDGGYICGGSSSSDISGDKTENCLGGSDYWVIKLDAAGNISWQNTLGGTADDMLKVVQEVPGGGYMVGGYSASSISADKSENNIGSNDYWIVRLDVNGNILWDNTIGGTMNDQFVWLQVTADGGCIVGGTSSSSDGDKTEAAIGATDFWVLRLNAAGNIVWQNTIGGTGADGIASVNTTSDGGYILAGYSNSNISGDKSENAIGAFDEWIVKLNASGSIVWENTIGSTSDDFPQYIEQTPEGGYILSGSSYCVVSGDVTVPSNGSSDVWVVKLNASGNITWQSALGGSSQEHVPYIHKTADGGFILSCYTFSTLSGSITEASNGSYDFWIVKLEPECFYPVIDSLVFTDPVTCAGDVDTLLIYGDLQDAQYWNITSGSCNGTAVDTTSGSVIVFNAQNAATFYVNGAGGCVANSNCSTVSLMVNPLPVTNAGNDTLICSGISVVLNASGADTYQWIGLPAGNPQTVSPVETDTFFVTGFTNAGCSLNDTIIINVSFLGDVNFSLPDTLCSGDNPVVLSGNPSGGVFSGPGVSLGNFNPAAVPSGLHGIQYAYTNVDGCTTTVSDTVFTGVTPNVYTSADTLICTGSSAVIEAYGASSYSWVGLGTANPQTVTPTSTTNYVVVGTSSTGCTNTDVVQVTVSSIPQPNFTMNGNLYCIDYPPVLLSALPGGGTYSGTGVSGNHFYPSVAGVGNYTLTYTVSNAFGCTASNTYQVTVSSCIGIEEYNSWNVQVGPNPFETFVNINSENLISGLELMDIQGKLIKSVKISALQTQVDLSDLSPGLYILILTDESGNRSLHKLIRQ